VDFEAIMEEVDELHSVSSLLEGLAEDHSSDRDGTGVRRRQRPATGGNRLGDPFWRQCWRARSRCSALTATKGMPLLGFPLLPVPGFRFQMGDTVQGIGNCLPLFGRSAMVERENALPFVDFTLRCLQALLHLGPVRLKNCGLVGFVPSVCHASDPFWHMEFALRDSGVPKLCHSGKGEN